jgi:[acyl-carrier-protein] S-malonyltransferase
MSLALVFPGQGSQAVGMGKAFADRFASSRKVFEEVDDALGEKLSRLIWEGPAEELTLTANAQPALMAVSMAALEGMRERGFDIGNAAMVAGHSLGEYSALCAAGAFSLGDTARLLRIRGNAMQKAVPVGEGAMAAIISLNEEEVAKICAETAGGGVCQIANDNGGGQIVISGSKHSVEAAATLASQRGARRAMLLPVSAPFHSALMAPAAVTMADALSKVATRAPVVPVVANVLAAQITEPEEIIRCLVEQVTGQVRWRESVSYMAGKGVTMAVEVGSGRVLSGLIRRIENEIKTIAVGSPDDLDAAVEAFAEFENKE